VVDAHGVQAENILGMPTLGRFDVHKCEQIVHKANRHNYQNKGILLVFSLSVPWMYDAFACDQSLLV